MKNISRIIIAAVLFCAAAVSSALSQSVTPGGPEGSYTKSCSDIKTIDNVTISAQCKGIQASFWSGGGIVVYDAKLTNYFSCDGDISNEDGVLCCKRNLNTPRYNAAAALKIITTRVVGKMSVFYADSQGDVDVEIQRWLIEYFKNGFGANYTASLNSNSPGLSATVEGYIKAHAEFHKPLVDNAFGEVYERDPKPNEQAAWIEQIATGQKFYAAMVADLKKKKADDDKKKKDDGTLNNN